MSTPFDQISFTFTLLFTVFAWAWTLFCIAYFAYRGVRDFQRAIQLGERLRHDMNLSAHEIDRITEK